MGVKQQRPPKNPPPGPSFSQPGKRDRQKRPIHRYRISSKKLTGFRLHFGKPKKETGISSLSTSRPDTWPARSSKYLYEWPSTVNAIDRIIRLKRTKLGHIQASKLQILKARNSNKRLVSINGLLGVYFHSNQFQMPELAKNTYLSTFRPNYWAVYSSKYLYGRPFTVNCKDSRRSEKVTSRSLSKPHITVFRLQKWVYTRCLDTGLMGFACGTLHTHATHKDPIFQANYIWNPRALIEALDWLPFWLDSFSGVWKWIQMLAMWYLSFWPTWHRPLENS